MSLLSLFIYDQEGSLLDRESCHHDDERRKERCEREADRMWPRQSVAEVGPMVRAGAQERRRVREPDKCRHPSSLMDGTMRLVNGGNDV